MNQRTHYIIFFIMAAALGCLVGYILGSWLTAEWFLKSAFKILDVLNIKFSDGQAINLIEGFRKVFG